MKSAPLAVVAAFVVAMPALAQEDKYATCLDYFSVGTSGCEHAKEPSKTTVTAPLPPAVLEGQQQALEQPTIQGPKTLEQRVDDFMEDHGKPPREFVEFHLEPSLENALKWVHKYNEMLERNDQLTKAWIQAEEIYDKGVSQGGDTSVFVKEALTPVPDFGVRKEHGLTAAMPAVPQSPIPGVPGFNIQDVDIPGFDVQQAYAQLMQPQQPNAQPFQNNVQLAAPQATVPFAPLGNDVPFQSVSFAQEGPLQVSYYFSAECPYCQRFEPEFQQLIEQNPGKLQVTCVDVTPTQKVKENILGKVDCAWRPLESGELDRMGVRTTPSLIINRGGNKPLERVSGYVPLAKLRSYLFK